MLEQKLRERVAAAGLGTGLWSEKVARDDLISN
jgi:hypothetical protein